MQRWASLTFIGVIFVGFLWIWNNNPNLIDSISEYMENKDFLTLEARFSPEEIMNTQKRELLSDTGRSYKESLLKFYPHLLIEAKYIDHKGLTSETTVLWSLVDGEMIIDTGTWEKTHGFQDALLVKASQNEFRILNILAKYRGVASKEQLKEELGLDPEIFEPWIKSARNKHLIIQKNHYYYLHFQNPKILVKPHTKIHQWLVTKPYNHEQKISKRFSRKEIEKIAKAAFGTSFTVRSMREIYVPIYSIEVLNPDGSIHTSFWNALNGQRIHSKSLVF